MRPWIALGLLFALGIFAQSSAYSVGLVGTMYGTGDAVLQTGFKSPSGFCYIVEGQCWYKSGETCQVGTSASNGLWEMYTTSGESAFIASFQCVTDLPTTNATLISLMETGTGTWGFSLMPESDGFCFLTRGGAWHGDTEHCHVYLSGGMWEYSASSQQDGYYCGTSCISGLEDYSITSETVLQATGDQQVTLVANAGPDVFCFITYGQQWYQSGEHCHVKKSGGDWILYSSSGMEYFKCGARCVYDMEFYDA